MALSALANTGIEGLDCILKGGLPRNRIYLVEGDPGVGKTSVALSFLRAGIAAGERSLYITLSETESEIRQIADSHGWSLEGLSMFELSALEQQRKLEAENTIFHASDVELTETTRALLTYVDTIKPDRIVFDSLSELRLLAQNALRYRREVLNLKQHFSGRQSTVLLLDDRTSEPGDMQLQSLAHGVLTMQQMAPEYGCERRRIRVTKLRGASYLGGYHDFEIRKGGLEVFPRLVAADHSQPYERTVLKSGLEGMDSMLGGGPTRGTSTLLVGPAGAGKSVVAGLYVSAAAARGEKCVVFAFDELRRTTIERGDALGLKTSKHIDSGNIIIQQIDPGQMSPGELAHRIQRLVDKEGVTLVVIDSLNGYLHAMPAEKYLYLQLHEMLTYLGQRGITTLMIMAQAGVLAGSSPVDISYIADAVVLFRYFEHRGRVQKAVSVVKKRTGQHEDTIRALSFVNNRVTVGEPLSEFRGVLATAPECIGGQA